MGCGTSKSESSSVLEEDTQYLETSAGDLGPKAVLNIKGSDYKDRLVTSETTKVHVFPESGLSIRYAYVSQRGYYPESLDKENQDSFCCHTAFSGNRDQALFGVFDGHGEFGTECSQYACEKLPQNFMNDPNFQNAPEVACHHACILTNLGLHNSRIDDSMSGTTAIMCLLRGTQLTIINVGDSRAVLAERRGTELVAQDVSWDQTPMRPDECERCKAAGALVMTLDQLEGLKDRNIQSWTSQDEADGDAPRLWSPAGRYPGTAFTRSIGDATAETIGVYAEPEVLVKRLTGRNPFIVVASDGVWEFLSSQSVVEMVGKYDDPLEAATAIVAESYRLWLQHESRTDDITMIIIQLQGVQDDAPTMAAPTPYGSPLDFGSKAAARAQLARLTRRIKAVETIDDADPCLVESEPPPPSPLAAAVDGMGLLERELKRTFLFCSLTPELRAACLMCMAKQVYESGDIVIQQGDVGHGFFIVESGQFDVLVRKADGKAVLVHTYTVQSDNCPSFGELSLLYGRPQAATIIARTNGVVWSLSRRAFKRIMARQHGMLELETLRRVKPLEALTWGQLERLLAHMHAVRYPAGELVTRLGEPSTTFGVIAGGEVRCTLRDGKSGRESSIKLHRGHPFSEQTLLIRSRRAATMQAVTDAVVLQITREQFEACQGPLTVLQRQDAAWRQHLAMMKGIVLQKRIANIGGELDFADLELRGTLYATDCSMLVLMQHAPTSNIYTLHIVEVQEVVAAGHAELVLRRRDLTRALEPSLFVPHIGQAFRTDAALAELLMTNGLCTVEHLLSQGVFDEAVARFVAACVVMGLEQLHRAGIAYRGLSVETLLVTEEGFVQLTDFRFAKHLSRRTYTMCGHPEYMAPEMVACRGHVDAVDWWALGVLIFAMLSRATPFAGPGDDEMSIYRKISTVKVIYPKHFSPVLCDLLERLLVRDPTERLPYGVGGMQALKDHPWFSAVDWQALATHDVQPPVSIRERIYNFEGLGIIPLGAVPVAQAQPWVMQF